MSILPKAFWKKGVFWWDLKQESGSAEDGVSGGLKVSGRNTTGKEGRNRSGSKDMDGLVAQNKRFVLDAATRFCGMELVSDFK